MKYAGKEEIERIGKMLEGHKVAIRHVMGCDKVYIEKNGRRTNAKQITGVEYRWIGGLNELTQTIRGDGWVAEDPSGVGCWRIWQGDKKVGASFHHCFLEQGIRYDNYPMGWDGFPVKEEA